MKSDLDARVEQDAIVVRGKQGVSSGFEPAHDIVHGVAVRNVPAKQRPEHDVACWAPQKPTHLPPRPLTARKIMTRQH